MPFPLRIKNNRSAFTLAEIMLVIATLFVVTSVSIPLYNRYIARNSMEIARQNIAQGLERAKLLSQIGMNDSAWGFSTIAIPGRGVLFMGDSFATRNPAFDELYSIPESVSIDGLTEVVFEKVTGIPSITGTITIISQYNEEVSVTVNLGMSGEIDVPTDWIEVCVNPYSDPYTVRMPDSLWTEYQKNGALLGSCNQIPVSSSSSSSSIASGGTMFSISNGTITIEDEYIMKVDKIGSALIIQSGYDAPITVRFKINGPYLEPWGDFQKPVDGNINTDQDFTYTSDIIPSDSTIDFWVNSFYKSKTWYDGSQNNHFNLKQHVKTPNTDGLVYVLVDGDPVPNFTPAGDQESIEEYLQPFIDTNSNTIQLPPNQVLYAFELWTKDVNSGDADFQDLVLLITFLES
jgi:hypothetical protein